jgi:hypothetical protein
VTDLNKSILSKQKGYCKRKRRGRSLIDISTSVATFLTKGMERRCENEKGKRNDCERVPLFDRKR